MSKRVLIVEDDHDFAQTLMTTLALKKHRPEIAHSGEEALEKARSKTYDVGILDIKMPGMNGLECLQRLKDILPEATSYIIMTGFRDAETLDEAATAAAGQVLLKPFSIYELLRMIEHP